ncbi:hypothetical protein AYL99_05076 [Fonsecaea erecta]|uniref:Uncharacterized protein n=1 Tax=Fonsecaea erecta TaxID=1367422 RepID=A0A178ZJW3_9EURO|nr:hypothetical protein AYL99_05076 [Fonsecaea erecta]OAP60074.1 hypothetical protein AYL99_05076 [Fonsecaea erecta]
MRPSQMPSQELDFERAFLGELLFERSEAHRAYVDGACSHRVQERQESKHRLLNSFLQSVDGGGSETIALLPGRFRVGGFAFLANGSQWPLEKSGAVDDQEEGEGDLKPISTTPTGLKKPDLAGGERCRVGSTRDEVPSSFMLDPLQTFFDLLENRGYEVPPTLTLQLALSLLKHGHAQGGDAARRKCFEDFALFMTCVGLDRMSERFDFGASNQNFFG